MTEHRLSRDPNAADPGWLTDLIKGLSAVAWTASATRCAGEYEDVAAPFRCRGQAIGASPSLLLRYCNGPGILRRMAAHLPAGLGDELRQLIDHANDGTQPETWQDVLDFVCEPDVWNALARGQVPMSGCPSVFVTFDAGQHTDRDDSEWIHAALAFWKPATTCFLEIRYSPDHVSALLYPTLADAGWFRYFRSAATDEPHGWTRPHDDACDPQPEAVHESASLLTVVSPKDIRQVPSPISLHRP